ncbi:MAG: glycosyltransferase family 39 protein [Candidatus Nanoarchaeia archaeon]|nr:glycosyltransferase family 39 protein [Candidatus Nanoarchaeia archaeon]
MKKEHIFLMVLLLFTFILRIYNANELTGGDDSEFAQLTTLAIKERWRIIYTCFPDEPMSYRNFYYSRPCTTIPLFISIMILGYNKYAILMPTLIFSILSVLLIYLIVKRQFGIKTAFIASILFAFSPFHIAFTRNSFLHGALTFYCLLATYFIIKAFEDGKNKFIYFAAFVCLANAWTTDFRGLIPIAALIPYIILKKIKKEQLKHIAIAGLIVISIYFAYMLIPLIFFKNSKFLESFVSMFIYALPGHGAIGSVLGEAMPLHETAKLFINYLIMTPFVGLIFIPILFGFFYSLKKLKKPEYALWISWFVLIIIFYIHGKPYVERQVVIVPAFAVLASIGITHSLNSFLNKKKKSLAFPFLIASTLSWVIFMIARFPLTYPAEYKSISGFKALSLLFWFLNKYYIIVIVIIFILVLAFSLYLKKINIKKQKSIASAIVLIYLLINVSVASALVIGGFGIYKRPDAVRIIGDYIKENIDNEKYACVAGVHDKSLIFYTQKVCASWKLINVSWIEEQIENNNLKYFVLNLYLYDGYTPGFGRINQSGKIDNTTCNEGKTWRCNMPEKYNWIMNNTIDITPKTGLSAENPYFRVYEYKK